MVDEAFTSVGGSRSTLKAGPIAARIGQEVRSWRQEAGVSENDLASVLDLPVDAVMAAENGTSCFTAEEIVAICSAFAVKPSRFLESSI